MTPFETSLSNQILMPLYTFLMEFEGGTYISQIKTSSPNSACVRWAANLGTSEIQGLDEKGKDILIKEMKKETIVPLNGVLNTWFTTALIRGKSAYINVVQTETTVIQ